MIRLTAAALMLAAPAWAMDPTASAPAIPCPVEMQLDAIPEPWEDNTATYANGEVRIVLIDLIEPAAAAFQLAILHPPRDEVGGRQCHLIAPEEFAGYPAINFADHQATYDPATGLTITISIQVLPDPDDGGALNVFFIEINQQTGEVRYQAFS